MKHRSKFQLSIDPSISSCGVCLWQDGKAIKWHTIKTPANRDLATRIRMLEDALKIFVGGRALEKIVVEEFQSFQKNSMTSMMKCSAAQGALVMLAFQLCDDVSLVNKRNEPKEVAYDAAIRHGLHDFDHNVADAFRLGQIAGFENGR